MLFEIAYISLVMLAAGFMIAGGAVIGLRAKQDGDSPDTSIVFIGLCLTDLVFLIQAHRPDAAQLFSLAGAWPFIPLIVGCGAGIAFADFVRSWHRNKIADEQLNV